MKDHEDFDVRKAKMDGFYEKYGIDDFIKQAATFAIENRSRPVSDYLGCFSNRQLVNYLRCGYQKTQATENKVRQELLDRIEIGDSVIALPFDLPKHYEEIRNDMIHWYKVTALRERQIRLEQGGWYNKNNICWTEMSRKPEQEA